MSDTMRIDGQKLDMHPARTAAALAAREDWEAAKQLFPIYVEVSPVGVCNHECTFCSVDYILDRTDSPRLGYDVFARTLEDMAAHGMKSVMFAGAGEPLLYKDPKTKKDLADIILAADGFGLDTAITTNAVMLNEKFCERAFQAKRLRWIRTSINAGDRDTYAKIHGTKPEDFDKVIANLAAAVKVRNRIGAGVQLRGQIVAVPAARGIKNRRSLTLIDEFPPNIHTVVPLALALREIGMDNLAVKPFKQHTVELEMTRSAMYNKSVTYAEISDTFDELEKIETKAFEITVRRGAMQQQDSEYRGYRTCYSTPYLWTYLEADGEIWGCSAYLGRFEHGKEIGDHRFRFGNVNDHTFTEIWQGDRRKACWEYTRKPPEEGGLDVSMCMKGCQMDIPNLYLWRVMNPEPEDNFIK